jgi:hypothetical protein
MCNGAMCNGLEATGFFLEATGLVGAHGMQCPLLDDHERGGKAV